MKTKILTALALVLVPLTAQANLPSSGVVAPGKKLVVYRVPSDNYTPTREVSFEIQCEGATAVSDPKQPDVTKFLAGVMYMGKGGAKCVFDNGDGTIESCTLQVKRGDYVMLEAYGDARKGDTGCSYTVNP